MPSYADLVHEALRANEPSLALSLIERASSSQLSRDLYYALRGEVFSHQLKFERAAEAFKKALQVSPNWAPAHNGLGNCLLECGRYQEALASFDEALRLQPGQGEFSLNRAQLRLLLGDWRGAREDYERRLMSAQFAVHPDIAQYPAWRGEDVLGRTILLYWEQGIGDTINFSRYARKLEERGAHLVLEVQDPLQRLFSENFRNAQVIKSSDRLPRLDYWAAIPSLPWIYAETPATLFAPKAYLSAGKWEGIELNVAGTGQSIGLVWAGNPSHANDKQRSITLKTILGLTDIEGARWYSLQYGVTAGQRDLLAQAGVLDLTESLGDFADTAAAIQQLDLVITVDTSVAHLAGALGKPVWVLLPFTPDWRWLLERGDSPWYPSARVFRQPKRGDWASVIQQVRIALTEFIG